ncbi:hypothetical protein HER15_07985 [Tenacibaculum mesophilum]|uniref:Uncharacterized protein n=1 Tax=Tenacibaculum mesophilum TaxID=104268 RepID=A0AAE9MN83_9FLAO|nr:hypothetical protein [Tenacibaculum mesophilum]UTD15407.1 hypothetical protein HER15_07985 [Tenacibaculum mesophilum]
MNNYKTDKLFEAIGIGFPSDKESLEAFDKSFEGYTFEADVNNIDPLKILNRIKNSTVTNIDYHKRTVLAAEIVSKLYSERTLGHLKLHKLLYLCQHTTKMNLHTNFLKQAMGPYDPNLMRSIDTQFKRNKWFSYNSNDLCKYQPLENSGNHKEWFLKYFNEDKDDIEFLIEKFRKFKSDQIEIVATIFACWKDAIEKKQMVNDELIIYKFYDWSENKKKYDKDRIKRAIKWMEMEGIYPS